MPNEGNPIEHSSVYAHCALLECRGAEPISFEPADMWMATGMTGFTFRDIAITEDFADFDEDAEGPVMIDNVEFCFELIPGGGKGMKAKKKKKGKK